MARFRLISEFTSTVDRMEQSHQLEPELSVIRDILVEPTDVMIRENIDCFLHDRGFEILHQVMYTAGNMGYEHMTIKASHLFARLSVLLQESDVGKKRGACLRTVQNLVDLSDRETTEYLDQAIFEHVSEYDNHFFAAIGQELRQCKGQYSGVIYRKALAADRGKQTGIIPVAPHLEGETRFSKFADIEKRINVLIDLAKRVARARIDKGLRCDLAVLYGIDASSDAEQSRCSR